MSAKKLYFKNSKEANKEVLNQILETGETYTSLRESISRRLGIDIANEQEFPISNPRFSWKKLRAKLEEANTSSDFSQLLRAGIQVIVNQMYQTVETTFEDWAHVVQSNKKEELYAPLHGIGFPKEVAALEPYPEVGAAGLDIKLVNKKYGELFAVEKELIEDDQTGQFKNQVGLIAIYLKQVLEVLAYAKLGGKASEYAELKIPACETKPSDEPSGYPYATNLVGGGSNRPATYQALSQVAIQEGIVALMNMKNKLGLKMAVNPKRLIISPKNKFDASILLHSAYYPSGAAASGQVGGAFAINPLQGILDLTVSRFVFDHNGVADGTSKAWYILDDTKPFFVVQVREAAAVEQEAVNSGQSFERDIIRFKGYTRCNADFIDPRFVYQGNDGSV